MSALDLLRALAVTVPDAVVALRLVDGKLVVGLCDRPAGKFYDAALDDADHARPVADVAREIAEFYAAARGAK